MLQPLDRADACDLRGHGQVPRQQHPAKAPGVQPRRGGGAVSATARDEGPMNMDDGAFKGAEDKAAFKGGENEGAFKGGEDDGATARRDDRLIDSRAAR